MKKLKGYEIRQMWLDFFASKGHEVIPSASLVPHNDPTLLWINAGVAPLKKYFDGREKPKNPRMTNAQKSIRTNDIDNVGRTSRHHTFFEMLGNFSIGDYFRDEVIPWASELLFDEKWFGFDRDRIYITYYPEDVDTKNKWLLCGVAEDHLIPLSGNFWEIGEGPCGPDTEIFFDRGEKYDPEHLGIKMLKEDLDNERYIEIWNIVFSQFNSVNGVSRDQYPELPSKNIDTGSGLERLACIFQETETNYETDLFLPLIKFVEDYTGIKYEENQMAFRVIADHIRSVSFAVADGAMLSNEGRGYVLRRILRRAVRYGRKLGINKPFLYKMVSVVIDIMKEYYPYLIEKQSILEKIIKTEEENFLRTLEMGEKKLNEIILNSSDKVVSGADAFLLYDTFGFPIELTEEISLENGFNVDLDGFKAELLAQKNRARAARALEQSMNNQNEDYLNFKEESYFVGYDNLEVESKVIAIFKDGKKVEKACGDLIFVTKDTPFYAEMGGQVGDQGIILVNDLEINVVNTFKLPNGQHAHVADTKGVELSLNQVINLKVDQEYRLNVSKNHSATHLLNAALKEVLGTHVSQQGSYVSNERLRFDFNHYNNLSSDEIIQIENLVNSAVKASYDVNINEMNIEDAKKSGAVAAFGEKYGETVRVVDMTYSKELCGGCHVKNTNVINKMAILSIESKGSGIFRIEAISGDHVLEQVGEYLTTLKDEIIVNLNKAYEVVRKGQTEGFELKFENINLPVIVGSYQDIINYRSTLDLSRKVLKDVEKMYDNMYRNKFSQDYKSFLNQAVNVNDLNVIISKVENVNLDVLKDIIDKLACEIAKGVIFFANIVNESKVIFIAKSKNCSQNCGNLVKIAAIATGGNGGGRSDFAQAGGKDATKVDEALNLVKESIK